MPQQQLPPDAGPMDRIRAYFTVPAGTADLPLFAFQVVGALIAAVVVTGVLRAIGAPSVVTFVLAMVAITVTMPASMRLGQRVLGRSRD